MEEDSVYVALPPVANCTVIPRAQPSIMECFWSPPSLPRHLPRGWHRRSKFIPLALMMMFALYLITILILARIRLPAGIVSGNPLVVPSLTPGAALFPTLIWAPCVIIVL